MLGKEVVVKNQSMAEYLG